jgi:hypothetical protein
MKAVMSDEPAGFGFMLAFDSLPGTKSSQSGKHRWCVGRLYDLWPVTRLFARHASLVTLHCI